MEYKKVWLEQGACGSRELWQNKFVLLIGRTSDPYTPSNKEENLCDLSVFIA